MRYIQITFFTPEIDTQDMIIALISDHGYEGFQQLEGEVIAYINADNYDNTYIEEISLQFNIKYKHEVIEEENWNRKWEENFQPVIVPGFCVVRADFHNIEVKTPYEIIINPKMSFGTGHHATTQLVMQAMKTIDFKGKRVLDFGTGTGILSILAEKLGATEVIAVDNDTWSYENAIENVKRNDCVRIEVRLGTVDTIKGPFDIILANINRHILLQYMSTMKDILVENGQILMSGLLREDEEAIVNTAKGAKLSTEDITEQSGWIAIKLLS